MKRKEDTKRTAAALHWWRKMLLGLRVLERMRVEYADAGGAEEEINPFVAKARREGRVMKSTETNPDTYDEVEGGGFLLPGHDEEETPQRNGQIDKHGEGGFLVDADDGGDVGAGGGFLLEEDADDTSAKLPAKSYAPITPVSLQSMHKAAGSAVESDQETNTNTKPARKATASATTAGKQRQPKVNGSKPRGRKPVVMTEDEESSLSDLTDSIDNDSKQVTDGSESDAHSTPPPPPRRKPNPESPQVVISPQTKVTPNGRLKKITRAAKKVTPVRSPYFDHGNGEQDEDEDVDDSGSAAEVVKPRRTTARTKART